MSHKKIRNYFIKKPYLFSLILCYNVNMKDKKAESSHFDIRFISALSFICLTLERWN